MHPRADEIVVRTIAACDTSSAADFWRSPAWETLAVESSVQDAGSFASKLGPFLLAIRMMFAFSLSLE